MRKLIFIHLFNDRSGSPKVLSQVIAAAYKRGRSFEILTSGHTDGFLSEAPGIHRTIFYRRSENKLITLFYYLITQVQLFITCLRYGRQDVTFYVNTMMPCGAALAAKIIKKPLIYHIHETSIQPKSFKRFLRHIIELTASKIIFVSDYLRKTESFENKKQYVVHNALDHPSKISTLKSQNVKFNTLMICSLKQYKGIYEFFEVAQLSLQNTSLHFTLVLNAEQAEINSYFKDSVIPSNVDVFPRQTDVNKFYASASLLVNLTRPDECIETFGLTILEGMSHSLPVIVPPAGGPAEIVEDGREGFLISCYETHKILAVIEKMASNPEFHSNLASNALARSKDFTLINFEEKIISIIDL